MRKFINLVEGVIAEEKEHLDELFGIGSKTSTAKAELVKQLKSTTDYRAIDSLCFNAMKQPERYGLSNSLRAYEFLSDTLRYVNEGALTQDEIFMGFDIEKNGSRFHLATIFGLNRLIDRTFTWKLHYGREFKVGQMIVTPRAPNQHNLAESLERLPEGWREISPEESIVLAHKLRANHPDAYNHGSRRYAEDFFAYSLNGEDIILACLPEMGHGAHMDWNALDNKQPTELVPLVQELCDALGCTPIHWGGESF